MKPVAVSAGLSLALLLSLGSARGEECRLSPAFTQPNANAPDKRTPV